MTNTVELWKKCAGLNRWCTIPIEEEFMQKRRQRSSLLFGGQNWFNSLLHYRFRARMIWRNGLIEKEKWTLGRLDASEQWDDLPVHTTPKHHHSKMDVLPKTFLQIILAAKWLVGHSSTSPKQQRRPLPSLLYNSFFYDHTCWPGILPVRGTSRQAQLGQQ